MGATAKMKKPGSSSVAVMEPMRSPGRPCAASISGKVTTVKPPMSPQVQLVRPISQTGGRLRGGVRGGAAAVSCVGPRRSCVLLVRCWLIVA